MLYLRKTAILTTGLVLVALAGLILGWLAVDRAQGANSAQSTPERIAGHEVLDMRNSDNTVCYSDDVPTIVLRASASSQENLLSSDAPNLGAIQRGLRSAGFPEGTRISLVGPGITAEMVSNEQARWNSIRETNGCIHFGGPQNSEALRIRR